LLLRYSLCKAKTLKGCTTHSTFMYHAMTTTVTSSAYYQGPVDQVPFHIDILCPCVLVHSLSPFHRRGSHDGHHRRRRRRQRQRPTTFTTASYHDQLLPTSTIRICSSIPCATFPHTVHPMYTQEMVPCTLIAQYHPKKSGPYSC
jgi:hypothetical protein